MPSRVRQMRGATEEATAAYMGTYVRIADAALDGMLLSAVNSTPDTRRWFDRLTIPSFVEGD